jgi:tetratricopeptide (TPR) repeat protein
VTGRILVLAALLAAVPPGAARAQRVADPINRAFALERQGDHAGAAAAFRETLRARPADLGALLGLERVLTPLGRVGEMAPQVRDALALAPTNGQFLALSVRVWAAGGQPDSARATVERWAALDRRAEGPFREWFNAALLARDVAQARAAITLGRQRLGRNGALAGDMAHLLVLQNDHAGSVPEWVLATADFPGYRATAVAALGDAPTRAQPAILARLAKESDPAARIIEASVRARYGDPTGGMRVLSAALPQDRGRAVEELRAFAELLKDERTDAAHRARGTALELMSQRQPAVQARSTRVEAAKEYAAGGARDDAQRVLSAVSADPGPGETSRGATATLIGVLVQDGKVEEAGRRLREVEGKIPAEEYDALRRQVALGWARAGEGARADSLMAADSTVEGQAVAGRIRLLRGDVRAGVELLRAAGPYVGTREEATERAALLSLLQNVEAESLPALGAAFTALARGDTAKAAERAAEAAGELEPARGGAALRLLAGRWALAANRQDDAERLFREAAEGGVASVAPSAELDLARLLLARGKRQEAQRQLEHLILTYPSSALVPQARRVLDESRGGVPSS